MSSKMACAVVVGWIMVAAFAPALVEWLIP